VNAAFPKLAAAGYSVTSLATPRYNCIAWAAGEDQRRWWPFDYCFWPRGVARELTLDAFIAAYRSLGYSPCDSGAREAGYEKVVIYVTASGEPTHAARQLPNGAWTSKLGNADDISHRTPEALEGPQYGVVRQYMRRPTSALGWATVPAAGQPATPSAKKGKQKKKHKK
jgi:hypothetical protein